MKLAIGTVLMGQAFLRFLPVPAGEHTAPLLALTGILLVFTLAELFISPVGLSLSTKLAPRRFTTQMVALYFLAIASRTAMSGRLAGYYDWHDEGGYFLVLGLAAVAVGLGLLAAVTPLRALMAGVH